MEKMNEVIINRISHRYKKFDYEPSCLRGGCILENSAEDQEQTTTHNHYYRQG